MAKIVVEFDTESKMMVVKKDGQVLDNVAEVSGFKMWMPEKEMEDGEMEMEDEDEGEPKFSLRVTRIEQGEDMVTYTTISANEYIKKEVTSLEDAIASHFDGVL
jgi:hypothetical protein